MGPLALHAPWRLSYMDLLKRQEASKADPPDEGTPLPATGNCFLREYWLHPEKDAVNQVIVRTGDEQADPADRRGGMILLNRYPYANGHLLMSLGVGRTRLMAYTDAERAELWSLVDLAVLLCERTLEPQGVNIGINQGEAGGAGVPEHLHVHVVPRWHGDVNFMTVVGQVRVIPSALDAMATRYRAVWDEMKVEMGLA